MIVVRSMKLKKAQQTKSLCVVGMYLNTFKLKEMDTIVREATLLKICSLLVSGGLFLNET